MAKRPSKQGLSTGILIVLLAGVLVSQALQASANHAPANKVVAAGEKLEVFGPGDDVTLLTTTLKTSKPTDLMIHVALECSILTKLSTEGGDIQTPETDSASANIDAWIEVTTEGQTGVRVVPIIASSAPPQNGSTPNEGDKEEDNATFCNRTYERTVTDREDDTDGIDGESDYIDTKSANAFNWVLLNAGSGVHTLTLKADLDQDDLDPTDPDDPTTVPECTDDSTVPQTCSSAFVGNRTMIVEPTKMSNDTVVAFNGTT